MLAKWHCVKSYYNEFDPYESRNIGNLGRNSSTPTKLAPPQQLSPPPSPQQSCTKCHENSADGLVSDARSQEDGWVNVFSKWALFFYFLQNSH